MSDAQFPGKDSHAWPDGKTKLLPLRYLNDYMRLTILQESRRNTPEWNPTFLKRYPALDKFSNLSFLNMRATGCYLNLKTSRLQNKIPYRWHRKSSGAGSCSYKEHMSWNDSVTRLRAEYCIKILFINMTAIRVWLKLAMQEKHS